MNKKTKYYDFGKALSVLISASNLNQQGLADKMGKKKQQISTWVRGVNLPSVAMCEELAKHLPAASAQDLIKLREIVKDKVKTFEALDALVKNAISQNRTLLYEEILNKMQSVSTELESQLKNNHY